MSERAAVLLRLLCGAHAGAEMELAPGEWMLGCGGESQIMISGPGVEENHLVLVVGPNRADGGPGQVRLFPRDGNVIVQGAVLGSGGMQLEPFEVFAAGNVMACIGPAGEPWPAVSLPGAVAAGPDDRGSAEGEDADSPDGAESPRLRMQADKADVGGNKVGGNPVGGKPSSPGRRLLRLAAVALLVLAFIGGSSQFFSSITPDELTASLRLSGYPDVGVVEEKDGVFTVQGIVPRTAMLDALAIHVEALAPGTNIQVLSLDAVADSLKARVKRGDSALRVSRSGPGIRVVGYIYNVVALGDLFGEDAVYLNSGFVKLDLVTWDRLAPMLIRLMHERDLKGRMRIMPGAYKVSVQTSGLSRAQENVLNAMLRDAEALMGDTAPFVREVWDSHSLLAPPPKSGRKIDPVMTEEGRLGLWMRPTDNVSVLILQAKAEEAESAQASRPQTGSGLPAVESPAPTVVEAPMTDEGPTKEGAPTEAAQQVPDDRYSIPMIDLTELVSASSIMSGTLQCGQLSVRGTGDSARVILQGSAYAVGSRMPNGLQVRYISPDYIVFGKGRAYIHFCTPDQMKQGE